MVTATEQRSARVPRTRGEKPVDRNQTHGATLERALAPLLELLPELALRRPDTRSTAAGLPSGRSASRRDGRPLHTFDAASCAPARVVVPEGEKRMNHLGRLPRPDVAAGHRPGSGSSRPSTQGPLPQPTVRSPRSGAAMRGHPFILADGISLQQCINELRTITERLNESGRSPRRLAILRRTQDHLEELARCPIYDIARLPAARMK